MGLRPGVQRLSRLQGRRKRYSNNSYGSPIYCIFALNYQSGMVIKSCINETIRFMGSNILYKWNRRVYVVQVFVQMKPQGLWGPRFCTNETPGFMGSTLLYKWNPKGFGVQVLVQMKPQALNGVQAFVQMKPQVFYEVQAFVQMIPQGLWCPSFCANETSGFMESKLLYKWNSKMYGVKLLYKWNPRVNGVQAFVQMKPQG